VNRDRHPFLGSWVLLSLLASLALVLGIPQYRWIGDVSRGERERLQSGFEGSLMRVSRDFDTHLSAAGAALVSNEVPTTGPTSDEAYASRYEHWRESARYGAWFRRVAIARPEGGGGFTEDYPALVEAPHFVRSDNGVVRRELEWLLFRTRSELCRDYGFAGPAASPSGRYGAR
jgi:hypothetical protein